MAHSHFLVELLYGPLGPENGPQLAEHIIGYSAKSGEYISGSWQFELLARHTTKKKNSITRRCVQQTDRRTCAAVGIIFSTSA